MSYLTITLLVLLAIVSIYSLIKQDEDLVLVCLIQIFLLWYRQ